MGSQSVLDAFTGTVIPDPAEPCLAGEASTCALAVESFDPNAQLWENAPLCADGADSPTLEDGSPACVWTGVDPRIVCAFALFGLLFDIGSLFAFRSFGQGDVGELVGTKKAEDESEGDEPHRRRRRSTTRSNRPHRGDRQHHGHGDGRSDVDCVGVDSRGLWTR